MFGRNKIVRSRLLLCAAGCLSWQGLFAQLALPSSPMEGNPADLEILVNPSTSSLFTAYVTIGSCRLQIHGDTVFLFEGASQTARSADVGDGVVLRSGQCALDLGLSKRFRNSYRLRIELLGANANPSNTTLPVIVEYSWIKDPYVFFRSTAGDWIVRQGAGNGRPQ